MVVGGGGRAVCGVQRVNFRLPLFTWGEAAGARGAGGGRGGAGRGEGAACCSRSRAAGGGGLHARRPGAGRWRLALTLLTGLEAPLLQLDEARRLEQRVEQAHGLAAGGARWWRGRCHAATGHARRGSRGRRAARQ